MPQPTPTAKTTPTESTQTRAAPPLDADAPSVSEQVIATVATVADVDPIEMEPLYRFLDPDSLDGLFSGSNASLNGRVTFTLAGCEVLVRDDETVAVTPPGASEPAWDTATDAVPQLPQASLPN